MRIIGVAGQIASGKDTVADYLVQELGAETWSRIGFANAVKKIYMDAFHVDLKFIEEWKRKDEPPLGFDLNVRKSLQFIGDGFRTIKSNIWIETALRGDTNIVISDVRYSNEAKAIKEQGGFTVALWRPGFENNDPNPSESQIRPYIDYFAKNYKEGPISDLPILNPPFDGLGYFDYFLINNGTKEELYAKIDNALIPYLKEMAKSV